MYWKKWAAKHEYEELKEGAWLEPGLALLRKKVKEIGLKSIAMWPGRSSWKEVGRKRDYSILAGRMLVNVKLAEMEEGTEKHRLYHCPEWYEVRREIPEAFRKLEQKARTSKKEWKWQRGIVVHPLSESQWNRGHFQYEKVGV